jgi:hypothetical protein
MKAVFFCLLAILLFSLQNANAQKDTLRNGLINKELNYRQRKVYLGDTLIKKEDDLMTLFYSYRPSRESFQFYLVYYGVATVFVSLAIAGLLAGLNQVIFYKSTNAGVCFAGSAACIGLAIPFYILSNISLRHAVKHHNIGIYK